MSLETTYQKLRKIEKMSSWKFMFWFSFMPALVSVPAILFINPTYVVAYENPEVKIMLITMLIMAFMAMYVSLIGGGIVIGIGLCWFLMWSRENFHQKYGTIIAHSLATNHEFLQKLADGLFSYNIQFIRGYNDPKFEELETKYERFSKELEELKNERKLDMEEIRRLNLELAVERELRKEVQNELEKVRQTNEESKTIIADKIQGNNKIYDTKP